MKRNSLFIIFLALFAIMAGYMLSRMSWIGRVGVNLFYTQYHFLKVWWQGAVVIFIFWMILYCIQYFLQRRFSTRGAILVQTTAICLAIAGLYFTNQDFRHTLSHRLLQERFHLGGYIFWIGWMCISIFLLTAKKKVDMRQLGNNNDTTSSI